MNIVKYSNIKDYWSKNQLFNNQIISKLMSREKFLLILRNIHFNYINQSNKLEFLIDNLNKLFFDKNILKENNLTIDKSLILFKGRLRFKQYLSKKANKFRVKIFCLAKDNGYIIKNIVYYGKNSNNYNKNNSFTYYLVIDLMKDNLNAKNHLFTDNYFTSVELANILIKKNIYLTGTLKKNRSLIPKMLKEYKLKKNKCKTILINDFTRISKYYDKKELYLSSTYFKN